MPPPAWRADTGEGGKAWRILGTVGSKGTGHAEDFSHLRVWLSAPHPPTCHILKEGEGVSTAEGETPTCDSEQDEQHDRLHVTLPLWTTDAGCLVQELVFSQGSGSPDTAHRNWLLEVEQSSGLGSGFMIQGGGAERGGEDGRGGATAAAQQGALWIPDL